MNWYDTTIGAMGALLLFVVAQLWVSYREKQKAQDSEIKESKGELTVKLDAIEDYARKTHASVVAVRVKLESVPDKAEVIKIVSKEIASHEKRCLYTEAKSEV